MIVFKAKIASAVPTLRLKPNWRSSEDKYSSHSFRITPSKTLEIIEHKVIPL
jgi:hypothetical protein